MPIKFTLPASIECSKASIAARKIIPGQPIRNIYPQLNSPLLYRFKLDFNCEAVIVDELDPKQAIVSDDSMLVAGDGIKGDMISALSTTIMKREKAKIKTASGRHQASLITLKGFIFAKLEKPFRAIENRIYLLTYSP